MGARVLRCFSWAGRRKRRRKGGPSPPAARAHPMEGPPVPHARPTPSTSSEPDGAFFSGKARVSFRHQLDSATTALDATG
ncbi:uncharacterized protein C17orf114 homolog [Chrysemys picta bellii]|uniref:uncharacterized protein C17orf114 homolog n=1 Tax=Chrysemys picta bellii TaxID=8478 RepID=UPI001C66685F|nr:uncharacterized protein C17orf114-like [Chrysemys picta bellii]